MSMPCDAIEQAEIGAVLPCYTMLHHALPFLPLFYAFGNRSCNGRPSKPAMTRSVASLISSMVMASTQQSYGSYGQCAAPPLSGERCNFRWMHQFTQVYTSLHCGKWETWETELWMNHDESRTAPSSVSPDDPRCNNINMQWSLRITDITVTDKSLTHLNHLTLQPSGRLVAPSRQDGRLVHQILQVSTAEAGSS